jgi:hypothetical protein
MWLLSDHESRSLLVVLNFHFTHHPSPDRLQIANPIHHTDQRVYDLQNFNGPSSDEKNPDDSRNVDGQKKELKS